MMKKTSYRAGWPSAPSAPARTLGCPAALGYLNPVIASAAMTPSSVFVVANSLRLQRMIEEDKYCIDILTQISAATNALQAVALGLLEEHLGHRVAQAVAVTLDQAGDYRLGGA